MAGRCINTAPAERAEGKRMKLYEFILKNNKISVKEYEVRETAKLYITQDDRYFDAIYSKRIEKERLNVVDSKFGERYYISQNGNMENAKKAFVNYLQNKVIPNNEKIIEERKAEVEKHRETIRVLTEE
jgi:hypothetical protein